MASLKVVLRQGKALSQTELTQSQVQLLQEDKVALQGPVLEAQLQVLGQADQVRREQASQVDQVRQEQVLQADQVAELVLLEQVLQADQVVAELARLAALAEDLEEEAHEVVQDDN